MEADPRPHRSSGPRVTAPPRQGSSSATTAEQPSARKQKQWERSAARLKKKRTEMREAKDAEIATIVAAGSSASASLVSQEPTTSTPIRSAFKRIIDAVWSPGTALQQQEPRVLARTESPAPVPAPLALPPPPVADLTMSERESEVGKRNLRQAELASPSATSGDSCKEERGNSRGEGQPRMRKRLAFTERAMGELQSGEQVQEDPEGLAHLPPETSWDDIDW